MIMKEKTRQEKYNEINVKQVKINLNKKTDADILEHLSKQDNKQGFIKQAIRDKMKSI